MNAQQRAQNVVNQIIGLHGVARARALQAACGDDDELRHRVEALLQKADTAEMSSLGITSNDLIDVVATPPAHVQVGRRLNDRFEVLEKIGAGGTAEVWKVRHIRRQRVLALKILTYAHPQLRQRFHREGQLQSRLRHRNIVRVFEFTTVADRPALVMEYVDGPNLSTFLKEHQPSQQQRDALAWDILSGVQAAHDAGLIHRDLKPNNILLARESDSFLAKIADFGLVRQTMSSSQGLTQAGDVLGTLAYMAPEQLRDARNTDARTDIWALGCVLYAMCTRQRAFAAPDNATLLLNIAGGQRRPLPDDLPARWTRAIDAALQIDPDKRPRSCDALKALLALTSRSHNDALPKTL